MRKHRFNITTFWATLWEPIIWEFIISDELLVKWKIENDRRMKEEAEFPNSVTNKHTFDIWESMAFKMIGSHHLIEMIKFLK